MHPYLISIGWFHLPSYGTFLALAIVAGIYSAIRLGRRVGVDSTLILDYSSWVILVALVGAKVLLIITLWSYYRDHPGEIFSYATLKLGGVFYGGFLAALIFTIWYVRVRKISFWKLTDVLVPSVAIGTTITRFGCFSAGCDYGKPTSVPWGVVFSSPIAHAATGVPLGVRIHPTQLYESAMTLAIFGILLWWFPRRKHDGDLFLAYLGLYAVGRFLMEFLRGDEDRGFVFHHLLSTSQFIALLVLAGIGAVLIWRKTFGRGELTLAPAIAGSAEFAGTGSAAVQVTNRQEVQRGKRKKQNARAGGRAK